MINKKDKSTSKNMKIELLPRELLGKIKEATGHHPGQNLDEPVWTLYRPALI